VSGFRPRVYLHIGQPKTGTTFVQQVLWSNRAGLASQGVMLPGYSHKDHSRASRDVREATRLADDPADSWAGEWDVLTGQALRSRGAAVISDEVLAASNPPQADGAIRSLLTAEVHVVLTVRDIASLLPAEWQENVKCRGTTPWEQWLADVMDSASAPDRRRRAWFWTMHDTLAILQMWSQHIPPDHVHVITVPRQGPPQILWDRFASVLGIDSTGLDVPSARVNWSLDLAEAEFLRRMNKALPDGMSEWFYTRNIKQVLGQSTQTGEESRSRLALPPAQAAWAAEQSAILVAGLHDAEFDIVGDVRELLSVPTTDVYVAPADMPAQELLEAAVHAAAALADGQYRANQPAVRPEPRSSGLRQKVSQLEWTILNGSWTRHKLRNASHIALVRRLRVLIWRVLMHPGRHGFRADGVRGPELAPIPDVHQGQLLDS
jgi:hypothetical protein